MRKKLWKAAKVTGIAAGSLLLLLLIWPVLFPGTAAGQIKRWANKNINGELDFSAARLSFFRHFPHLTLTLHDFSVKGSAPFEKDTLLAGEAISFGIDLGSLFRETVEVNTFFIDDAFINVQVDEQGQANYNIYKEEPAAEAPSDSSDARLKIEGIFFNRCHLIYEDRSVPMRLEARGFDYEGRGDLSNGQFDLVSVLHAEGFDFTLDGTSYLQDRELKADLITGINTAALSFRFAKNNLLINKLPVDFTGEMIILKDGYDIDLHVVSGVTDFGNIFSVLPPAYAQWFADTQFEGQSQIQVALGGAYRAATGQAPDLSVRLWVRDGLIRHKQAPAPLEGFRLNGMLQIPGLQPDSLSLALDTLQFRLGGAFSNASILLRGLNRPYIKADLEGQLDLGLLDEALGLSIVDLRGRLFLNLRADGHYLTGPDTTGIRPATVVTSIPAFQVDGSLQDGYFKYDTLELPVREIAVRLQASCLSGRWRETSFSVDTVHALLGNGLLEGRLEASRLDKPLLKAALNARLRLEDLTRAIPIEGYVFRGNLLASLQANGPLDAAKKRFPVVGGKLEWENGFLQTPYYPQPIEQIQVKALVNGQSGTYSDLSVRLQPLSFVFEQQPFSLNAELLNPADLRYDLSARGTLDLGRIYQVFAIDRYQVGGLLLIDLDARGTEADALAGRYGRLRQKGTLQVKDLELRSEDYPDPFFLPGSTLRFDQDKAWLSGTLLRYRQNEFTLNGYAQNIIGYLLGGSPLMGKLSVSSPRLLVDDFMAFAAPARTDTAGAAKGQTPASGIVLLPEDMDLTLEASVKEIRYGTTRVEDFSGQLALQKGALLLRQTQFNLAGATLAFEGDYRPLDVRKALFTLQVKADSFDVQRAYREIPLFRELAGAAARASGLISLEYQLQGRLNDQMMPVNPSIKGQGTLTLEQVKIKGLKLFGAVSKATGNEEINDPDLRAVVMRSSIANNILTIERTRMKVLGFRPRIEGQVSLDGRMNLRFRLGLPPLGVIGIPMTITGTSENPVVEIRRGEEADELEEEVEEQ